MQCDMDSQETQAVYSKLQYTVGHREVAERKQIERVRVQ